MLFLAEEVYLAHQREWKHWNSGRIG